MNFTLLGRMPDTQRELNMELLQDISRRWKRLYQLVFMTCSLTLLYMVLQKQYLQQASYIHHEDGGTLQDTLRNNREMTDTRDITAVSTNIRESQEKEMTFIPDADAINSMEKNALSLQDVDTSPVTIPTEPIGDPTQCPLMLKDIEVAPRGSMLLIALASFPRSGNTWTRLLLQVASKLYTGTVFWETEGQTEWSKNVFKAGNEDFRHRTGVCVKSHYYSKEHIEEFTDGAILLLRNPYYSLVSEFFRELGDFGNKTKEETIQAIADEPRWKTSYFDNQSNFWRMTALNWINYCDRLLVIFYEDLERKPMYVLSRMLQFLKQPKRLDRLECALQLFPPNLNHTHVNFDPYNDRQKTQLNSYIAEVNAALVRRNGPPLPVYNFDGSL